MDALLRAAGGTEPPLIPAVIALVDLEEDPV